jgi:outer membrane beta-barrel protein
MKKTLLRIALLSAAIAVSGVVPLAARAADEPAAQKQAQEQVVVPEVDRRDIHKPKFPSNDFEISLLGGTYATQNFGSSAVYGLRLGYYISEDFFVEGTYAQSKISDELFRQVLPGGIFPNEKEKLTYYNLSIGYNVLPGEVFIGAKRAKPIALYVIGGVGSTKFDQQRRPTFNVGMGVRLFLTDAIALQVDMRDHIFSLDLLGKRQSTQNLEWTGGLAYFF